jgi:hypothetical protein
MANRLMSAYGNLAQAKTNIGRNLSDIAGIGIEMEYGKEGRIAGQISQQKIANETAAIGLGLESVQKIAGLGVEYDKETESAKSVGGSEIYKKKVKNTETGKYETQYSDKGNLLQKLGRFLGFSERQFDVGGDRFTGAQIEAAVPYTKIGKTWAEAAGLVGGGSDIQYYGYDDRETPNRLSIDSDELSSRDYPIQKQNYTDPEIKSSTTILGGKKLGAYFKGGSEQRDAQGNLTTTLHAASEGPTTTYGSTSSSPIATSQYTDQSMMDRVKMYKGKNWAPDHTINMDYWSL